MGLIEPRRRGRPKNKIPRKPERKLYKIDQIIRTLGITGRTIRYYDQMGLLPHVKRSDGGIRLFDDQDIELIKKIRKLQKEAHLSLTKIRDVIFKTSLEKPEDASRWVVVTDSLAILPDELKETFPIETISFKLSLGDNHYTENQISPIKLWEKAESLGAHPQLTAPSEADFIKKYHDLANQGFTKIYSIHSSSVISDAFHNALAASHKVSSEIEVIVTDSKSAGPALGLLVKRVGEAIAANGTALTISMLLEKQVSLAFNLIMLNGMNYLTYGNKLENGPQYLLNAVFSFKPVLSISHKTGQFEPLECAKDKLAGMRLMVEMLESEIKARGGYVSAIAISYNYLYGEAVELVNEMKVRYHNAEVHISEGGPTLSGIIGPETLSIGII